MTRDLTSARYRRLRELLIAERKNAKITQSELAKRVDRTQSFVADFERSERRLDIIDYLSLADAIGFDPLELLGDVFRVRE